MKHIISEITQYKNIVQNVSPLHFNLFMRSIHRILIIVSSANYVFIILLGLL